MVRIKYIIPEKNSTPCVNGSLFETLRQRLQTFGEVQIVDSYPELVHILGLWTKHYANVIKRYRRIGVPVVFTSIEGLSLLLDKNGNKTKSISRRSIVRRICKKCSLIHVCGPAEESFIRSISKNAIISLIPNANVTALIEEEAMLHNFISLYANSYLDNDEHLKENIKSKVLKVTQDETIAEICMKLMYIKNKFISGCIRQTVLDRTASVMKAKNYDENEMAKSLKSLGLFEFSQACMSLLESNAGLTEGFMPIPSKKDDLVKRMQKMIVQ